MAVLRARLYVWNAPAAPDTSAPPATGARCVERPQRRIRPVPARPDGDHRINLTLRALPQIMAGDIIDALVALIRPRSSSDGSVMTGN
ncbi:MAG: hypothetical protein R3D56_13440 [Paracoccaceae bacterium]